MRGSKKQKLKLEKQLRETRLMMDVLDNNSQRETQTNVTLDRLGIREDNSEPDADKQKMEKFEIETENEEYSGYIYKVKNPLQRLWSVIRRNQKLTFTILSLLLICIIVVPIVVTFTEHKENQKTTTTMSTTNNPTTTTQPIETTTRSSSTTSSTTPSTIKVDIIFNIPSF